MRTSPELVRGACSTDICVWNTRTPPATGLRLRMSGWGSGSLGGPSRRLPQEPNPVNPNAILLLQQPADRDGDGVLDITGVAPVCTKVVTGVCTQWTNPLPPEGFTDLMMTGAGSPSPYFGVTNAGTAAQSYSRTNWYPINFYDTREGET